MKRTEPKVAARVVTQRELLGVLRVSKYTLRRWISRGKCPKPLELPGRRKFDRAVIADWLRSCGCTVGEIEKGLK